MDPLSNLSVTELLQLRADIDAEVARRGHARTSSSLAGELMEKVVAAAYGGSLAPVGRRSIDVTAGDGRSVQVKTRSLPKGDLRHWAVADFEFDAIVLIAVDRATGDIDWARELTSDQARAIASPHAQDGWRIRMRPARSIGLDVSGTLRRAFFELR